MTNEELKKWVDDHVTGVRPQFTLFGVLTALISAGYSLYSGSVNDSANTRRLDEAISRIEIRMATTEKVNNDVHTRIWADLEKQRKEIKDDMRYEIEHRGR